MNVYELTRALVDIESITENEGAVAAYLHDHLAKLAARTGGQAERMDVEPGRFNVLATWGEPRGDALDAHGHGAAVFPVARGRGIHLGARRMRREGNYRGDGRGGGKAARRGREEFRAALCGGRGAQQRGSGGGGEGFARVEISGERRADRKQNGARIERNSALRSDRARKNGAFGVSGAGRIGDREAARRARCDSQDAAAARSAAGAEHHEYRHDFGRPRAQRDSGRGQSGNHDAAGRRCAAESARRLRAP